MKTKMKISIFIEILVANGFIDKLQRSTSIRESALGVSRSRGQAGRRGGGGRGAEGASRHGRSEAMGCGDL
jgi:hypothetical protein